MYATNNQVYVLDSTRYICLKTPFSEAGFDNKSLFQNLKDYLHLNHIIFMSNSNRKKAKTPSRFVDAVTGKTYTKADSNAKATKAAEGFAKANPKKAFYA